MTDFVTWVKYSTKVYKNTLKKIAFCVSFFRGWLHLMYDIGDKQDISYRWGWHVFWVIVLCSLVEVDRGYRGAYYLHHDGAQMMEAVGAYEMSVCFMKLHSAITQKAVIFILAAARTRNLSYSRFCIPFRQLFLLGSRM
jgi:hypothetical protein